MQYNMRLKVQNLFERQQDVDYYNPIDFNHIFAIYNVLDSRIREEKEPVVDGQSID